MSRTIVVAQGGGPTAVINQTVAGVVLAAREAHADAKVLGAKHGVRGIDGNDYVDLSGLSDSALMRFANTPNSGLGSTRDKPDAAYCQRVLKGLDSIGADTFIYIGGNDTSGTLALLDEAAEGRIRFIHAPKTIDNDLVENDHTPGFISAALFVANAFLSVDLDFRAMPGVYIGIVMGRHAGFLTAAAAAWRRDDADGPHLIYVPEVAFDQARLLDDIQTVLDRHGRCVVAMSEGVQTADHRPLAESLIPEHLRERDAHGNLQLSGGDLGLALQQTIKDGLPRVRARVDTFGYLPRGFLGTISETDRQEAMAIGRFAIADGGTASGSVAQQYECGRIALKMVPLQAVANKTKTMPTSFLTAEGNQLAAEGLKYFGRLLPPRPDVFTPFV